MRIPDQQGFSRGGNPFTSSSTLYAIHDMDGLADMVTEILVASAFRNGVEPTAEVWQAAALRAARFKRDLLAQVRARGVSHDLRRLLKCSRKKDAVKLSKRMTITAEDFADLVMNCGTLGLSHYSKHFEFVPTQRQMTATDHDAMRGMREGPLAEDARKAQAKLKALYRERERRSVHLFANNDNWHIFFFTFRDLFGDPETREHHWTAGSHIHFYSHLFTTLPRLAIWNALDSRDHGLKSEHVRWAESDTPAPLEVG